MILVETQTLRIHLHRKSIKILKSDKFLEPSSNYKKWAILNKMPNSIWNQLNRIRSETSSTLQNLSKRNLSFTTNQLNSMSLVIPVKYQEK